MKLKLILFTIFLGLFSLNVAVADAQSANISLYSAEDSTRVGSSFLVDINVETNMNTLGADLVLKFDPKILSLSEIVPGVIYQDFSSGETLLNDSNKDGMIYLSGISDFNIGVVPNGIIATLRFSSLQEGKTDIEVLYSPSDSTLTGIIPFEGIEDNLLDQAPEPLSIEVISKNWLKQIFNFFRNLF